LKLGQMPWPIICDLIGKVLNFGRDTNEDHRQPDSDGKEN